jgi:DNA-binding NarL/FixJ family response regulator
MLSGQDDEETIREALRRGAQGYVVKGSRTDLGKAIRAVNRGEVWARRRVLATVIEEMVRREQACA